jgi:hypothetical protein
VIVKLKYTVLIAVKVNYRAKCLTVIKVSI